MAATYPLAHGGASFLGVEAERHLTQALATPNDPWIAKNRVVLTDTRKRVRDLIGEIAVTGSPVGAEALLNGRAVGNLPLASPLRVGQGPVTVEVRASGYLASSSAVEAIGGTTFPQPPVLHAQGNAAGSGDRSLLGGASAGGQPNHSLLSWSLLGGGAAAVVAGVVWLSSGPNECVAMPGFECSNSERHSTIAPWGIVGAGAAVGLSGAILLLVHPKDGVAIGIGPSAFIVRGRL